MGDFTCRKFDHDYKGVCSYHIIFRKNEVSPDFGELRIDPYKTPGDDGYAYIHYSPLGHIILKEIYDIHVHQPQIVVTQYKVMPDHVHLLIRVMERIPHHIGLYMGLFMRTVTLRWRIYNGGDSNIPSVFERNYTDRPIYNNDRYVIAKKYIKDNPYRLAMRRIHPEFFRRVRDLYIDGVPFQAYGNLFHLRNPFISQVIVHSANTQRENDALFALWRDEIEKGGILVSPFIAPPEKQIRKEAVENGGRIIHIQKDPFGERFKPAGADFELCCQGQLLIIAPVDSMGKAISRQICKDMNKIAENIAKGNFRV